MSLFGKILLLASVSLFAPCAHAQTDKKLANTLPASVAATMPTGVLDIATYRLAPAPGEPQLLVHLWCAPRRNPEGAYGYGPDYYTGKITREEAGNSEGLRPSPFIYDIFASDGKGGWSYRNSIFHNATSTPGDITLRYLNNQTKSGYVFEINGFYGDASIGYRNVRTLYVFTNANFYRDYSPETEQILKRDFSDVVRRHVLSGQIYYTFDRDARGYLRVNKSQGDLDLETRTSFDIRTVFNWDKDANDWKAEVPQRVKK